MTAREPDPVSGAEVARVAVPGGDWSRERVEHGSVCHVVDAVAGIHHAPREVDALVHEPELGRPAACLVEDLSRHRDGALPYEGHFAWFGAGPRVEPRNPVARAWLPARLARVDAQLNQADVVVLGEEARYAGQRVRLDDRGVVVEEEEVLALCMRDAGVAARRDAYVGGEAE